MTAAERRERARLRAERWRRAHGIMPRRPAQRPWLAMGVSRSTWYRRGNRVRPVDPNGRQQIGIAPAIDLTRATAFVRQLQTELAEVARCQAVTAAIIGELASAVPHIDLWIRCFRSSKNSSEHRSA
jgi:ribosomal protein L32E